MKKILSLLMCYVFLQAETFALRGGPGGKVGTPLSGAYSAILIQTSPEIDFVTGTVTAPVGSGIGLVLLNVPQTGPATGDFLTFDSGTGDAFNGTANGLTNIGTGQLVCILSADKINGANVGVETISGTLKAGIQKGRSSLFQQISGTATLRISGIPIVFVSGGNVVNAITSSPPITYDLIGYQSSTAPATGAAFDITFGTGTTPASPTP